MESILGVIQLLGRLLASCQLRSFPRVFTEKCFAVFDQSSCAIYLTWYRPLLFFWEFSSIIPFMVWLQDSSEIKGRGYIFKSSTICYWLAGVIFFNGKLNVPAFIFSICPQQFWTGFSRKLAKTLKISIVFSRYSYLTPCMTFESRDRSIDW